MSELDNIELVKRCYKEFVQGHIERVLELFGDDLDFQHPMPQSIWPWAGRRRGRQGLAEYLAGLGQTIEYERFEPHEFIAQGQYVVVILFERGRVKSTGVAFDNVYCMVWKFAESKVSQIKIFEDTAPIIAALQGYRK
jgi:ketosteroid isomerase-like protein